MAMEGRYRYGLRRQLLLNLGLVVLVIWGLLSLVLTRAAYLRFMKERVRYIHALSEQLDRIVLLKYAHQRKQGMQLWFGGSAFRRDAVLWPTKGLFMKPSGQVRPLFGLPPDNAALRINLWLQRGQAFKLEQLEHRGKITWVRYRRLLYRGKLIGVLWLSWDVTAIRGEFFSYQGLLFLSLLLFGFLILFLSMSFLERRLIKPLARLGEAITLLAMGQSAVPELGKELGRRDEIGDLGRAFAEMEHILRRQAEEREQHILELAQANVALERAQEELVQREKMATLGHLAAGVAHEVGNPLSAIMGYSELLRMTTEWGEMEADLVERVHKETQRIDRIIRDLLDYARPVQHERPGNPGDAIHEALELLRLQQRFKSMKVEILSSDIAALPQVTLSENILIQVLINLLLNAADACEGGGTVWISAQPLQVEEEAQVRIELRDDGPGIAPEIRDRLFEPFATTKAPGKGVGLGLALCQRIVVEGGGKLEVVDSPEPGACFWITLPQAKPPVASEAQETEATEDS